MSSRPVDYALEHNTRTAATACIVGTFDFDALWWYELLVGKLTQFPQGRYSAHKLWDAYKAWCEADAYVAENHTPMSYKRFVKFGRKCSVVLDGRWSEDGEALDVPGAHVFAGGLEKLHGCPEDLHAPYAGTKVA